MAVKPVKVSELNSYIDRLLMTDPLISNVIVTGEVTGMKVSGRHMYFSLKDEESTIRCFLPDYEEKKNSFLIADGMETVIRGYVNVYKKGGYYSFCVREIEISGEGQLAAAFEQMKKKLQKEGLFDQEHKKQIPEFPGRIILVTSEHGAAVQDMTAILTSRNPLTEIIIIPVLVQGQYAAQSICDAFERIEEDEKLRECDLVILGRGGGSAEDLWTFNEESVARAVYRCSVPVISAVGHETDWSISDLVADRRAETPTAAAQMAVPHIDDLKRSLELLKERADGYLDTYVERHGYRLKILFEKLQKYDPVRILSSGYGAVTDEQGCFVRSSADVSDGDRLHVRMHDGRIDVVVEKVVSGIIGDYKEKENDF